MSSAATPHELDAILPAGLLALERDWLPEADGAAANGRTLWIAPRGVAARVGAATVLECGASELGGCLRAVLRDVRIACGAVAPTPIRAPRAEAALEGRSPDAATIEAAAQAALQDVHPISDLRASDWYRRELVHNLLQRVLSHVSQL